MAYVICVCGAGGKTTLCHNIANKKALENNKVCILTTTHMWKDNSLSDIKTLHDIKYGLVYFFGNTEGEKVIFVNDDEYIEICNKFDYVIIEADGSKCMPIKIPNSRTEPKIPNNVNEIIVVYGKQALDRKIGVVCHRFIEFLDTDKYLIDNNIKYDTYVTERIYDEFRIHYYLEPLKIKYPKTLISIYDTDMKDSKYYEKIKNVAIVICASGFSTRFGKEDKLVTLINNKKMYELMMDKIVNAKKLLIEKFVEDLDYSINIDVAITVRENLYNEVCDYGKDRKVITILNNEAIKGLSSSIKISTEKFIDKDAIMFINCDLPYLEEKELMYFLFYSICNKTNIASMFTDGPKNPAYFEKEYFDSLLKIDGDKGPRELLQINKQKLYRYHIDEKELIDIDTKEDLGNER